MINKNIQEGKVNIQKVSHAQRNADIDSILCGLTAKQASMYEKRDSATMGEYLEYIVCIISTYVGEQMKADEALLLPKLQKEFTREIYAYTASFVNVSVCESDIPSSRWLLSQLHVHFENMYSAGRGDMVHLSITRAVTSFMLFPKHWEKVRLELRSATHTSLTHTITRHNSTVPPH